MFNFLKRVPPFSSIWIKKQINKEFNKIALLNTYITKISTLTAERINNGWEVYVKIKYPITNIYDTLGWTSGFIYVLDKGKVDFSPIIDLKDCFYSKSIIDEAMDILKNG